MGSLNAYSSFVAAAVFAFADEEDDLAILAAKTNAYAEVKVQDPGYRKQQIRSRDLQKYTIDGNPD